MRCCAIVRTAISSSDKYLGLLFSFFYFCFYLILSILPDHLNTVVVDFRVAEFYVAPAGSHSDEEVPDTVYSSSGKYIDPVILLFLF